jgi:alkylation response protein AidB-like acyl-CoA dehydrogenase
MLDLTFSPEQEMLRETVRGAVATTSPLAVVREPEDDALGYSPELWKQLAHLDLIGLQLPEAYDGSGMTTLESVVVYEEFGRSLAPSPHFVSSILSGSALARSGSAEQKQAWLPGIVSGEAVLTPAWMEPENSGGPGGYPGAGDARRRRLDNHRHQAARRVRIVGGQSGGTGPDR